MIDDVMTSLVGWSLVDHVCGLQLNGALEVYSYYRPLIGKLTPRNLTAPFLTP